MSYRESVNSLLTMYHRAGDSRGLHVSIAVVLAMLWVAVLAPRTLAQNIQYDDKALDLGLRSDIRVDPRTRSLSFEIPLGSYPGRSGFDVPVTLSYTSKVWNVEFQAFVQVPPPPFSGGAQPYTIAVAQYGKHSVSGWTSSINMPLLDSSPGQHFYNQVGEAKPSNMCPNPCYLVDRKTIWMPDGSGHELRATDQPRIFSDPLPDNYYAVDESRMRYQASTQTLFMSDGSRYLLGSGEHIDRNGNKLTSNNGVWTDTLGRQIANPLPGFPAAGDQNAPVPGVGGTPVNYVLKWRNLLDPGVLTTPETIRYVANGGCPPGQGGPYSPYLFGWDSVNRTCIANSGTLFNPVVLYQIVLPTGQAYTFTYNIYGEIDKVVLPTGGYEKYTYSQVTPLTDMPVVYSQANRGVSSRTVSSTGLAADELVWTYSSGSGTTTIIGPPPESKRTEVSFWTDSNGSWGYSPNGARAGRIYDERTYNSANQLLRRKLTDWTMTGSNATGNLFGSLTANRHARPIREVEFVLDNGTSAVAKTKTFTYETTYQFSVGVEVSTAKEYDFLYVDPNTVQNLSINSLNTISNGTLLRKTTTTYLTSDQNYRDRNLLGLPTSVTVYDSNDALLSQSTSTYDEYDEAKYPLIPAGSPPYTGWTDPATPIRGNVTTAGVWLNTSGAFLQTHAQYDQFGNVRKEWDARQNLTLTDFSSTYFFAYPTQVTSPDPDGAGPATALVTQTEYDFTTGRTAATIDSNNQRTTFAYNDPLNRIRQVVRASNDTAAKTQTTFTYDDANRTVTTTKDLTAFEDNVIKEAKVFDAVGRLAEHRQYDTPTTYITVKTDYDKDGRAYRTSNPYGATDPVDWTITDFDLLGRVTAVTTPDGAIVRTSYAGDRLLITDQAGKQSVNKIDADGQLLDVWEVTAADSFTEAISFPSHPEVAAGYRTSYQYDGLGNRVKVTQGSQQRFFMYDSLNRPIRMRAPEMDTYAPLNLLDPITGNTAWSIKYQYDSNGNLTQKTDARGVVTTYAYDALDRNTTIDYSDTASINPDVQRVYDGATNGKGRFWYVYKGGDVSTGTNVENTIVDSYDAVGRPKVQRQLFKLNGVWSAAYQTSCEYDRSGAVTSQIYPSGHTVSYSYDSAGRTIGFTGNLGDGTTRTYANNITYSVLGGIAKEQFGTTTSLYHKRFYNIRGQLFDTRLSSVNDTWDWNRGRLILYYSSNHIWGQSGTDNNGTVRFAETWIPPENAALDQADTLTEDSYTYDALNRLTSVAEQRMSVATGWGNWQPQFRQQYTHDRFGNRTIDATQTWGSGINNKQYTVNIGNNRLGVPVGQSGTMSYDAAGNLTTDSYTTAGSGGREYDANNRMTRAQGINNQWQEYAYNATGQRVRRKVDGQETWQIYGFRNELIAEYAAIGFPTTPQREYGYRNGQLLVTATNTPGWGSAPVIHDNPLVIGQTTVQALHITELRSGINALRSHLNLPAYSWQTSATTNDWITASPILEMRTALDQALGPPANGYSLGLSQNQFIKAVHIQELRDRVLAAWITGTGVDLRWLVTDQLNTPRMIVDQSGALANISRHDYLPFGEELLANTGGRTTAQGYTQSDGLRQRFTQKERDVETGLDYFHARYYSAIQGRFTSFDPEGSGARDSDPQSWNGFAYSGGNPMLFSDPDGKKYRVCDPTGKICTTVSDDEFQSERKALKETGNVYTGSGNFYEYGEIKNANGEVVARYVQFSIDDLQHRQLAAIAAAVDPIPMATLQFFGIAVIAGTTGGVGYYLLGPTTTISILDTEAKTEIPSHAKQIWEYIKNNGTKPPGYKGGKPFLNDGRGGGQVLPRLDSKGSPVSYQEFDVNPFQQGVNRGAERIVKGSDGSAYFTSDHYKTFIKIE